jgi:hypothetical protein
MIRARHNVQLLGTPAAFRRRAYSISSSTKRSIDPTAMNAGGSPARFSTRAGTEPAGTFVDPAGISRSDVQPNTFDSAVHTNAPMCGGSGRLLPVRSSSIGKSEPGKRSEFPFYPVPRLPVRQHGLHPRSRPRPRSACDPRPDRRHSHKASAEQRSYLRGNQGTAFLGQGGSQLRRRHSRNSAQFSAGRLKSVPLCR